MCPAHSEVSYQTTDSRKEHSQHTVSPFISTMTWGVVMEKMVKKNKTLFTCEIIIWKLPLPHVVLPASGPR